MKQGQDILSTAIVLFVFNRPKATQLLFESLLTNPESKEYPIFVFADGPRTSEEKTLTDQVKSICYEFRDELAFNYIQNSQNKGLKSQVSESIEYVFSQYDSVIVFEDDLELKPNAIQFLLKGLNSYRNDSNVYQISAYQFPVAFFSLAEQVFLPNSSTWGWATWKEKWKLASNEELLELGKRFQSDKILKFKATLNASFPYETIMQKEIQGLISSWGIRFWAHIIEKNGTVIYPGKTRVLNHGFNELGTHTKKGQYEYIHQPWKNVRFKKFKNLWLNIWFISHYFKSFRAKSA